ncbi:MAG: SpoIID/LytB domain-containing protein [Candidatus Eisenbacteria bacterium]|nr:SpoIID/LytB domain-containing protein [Candidatus Eisenbacteria bacterium]
MTSGLILITGIAILLAGCSRRPKPVATAEPPTPTVTEVPFSQDPVIRQEPTLRVAIVTNADNVELTGEGSFRLTGGALGEKGKRFDKATVILVSAKGHTLQLRANGRSITAGADPIRLIPDEDDPVQVNKSRFRGGFEIRPGAAGGITILNRIPMEEYLRGVVPNEIGHGKPDLLEAVKAQAVAARTYALISRGQYEAAGYDLLATVADQVYSGVAAESPIVDQALHETRGVVALYQGQPIVTNYASTCGGHTADRDEVWEKPPLPYLRGVPDKGTDGDWCQGSKYYRWEETWPGDQLWKAVRLNLNKEYAYGIGEESRLKSVRITETGPSGRVRKLAFETTTGTYEARGDRIRWILSRAANAGPLRSILFEIDTSESSGRLTQLTAKGAGWGHGVGMCQWGAMTRSRKGQDFRRILGDYYQGAQLAAIYP